MAQRPSESDGSNAVTAEQVRALCTEVLAEVLPLGVQGYRYADADLYNVLVGAAAQQRSIESVCRQLVQAPSANLVRHYLAERLLDCWAVETLEAHCNDLLTARLPQGLQHQRHQVAIDLHLVPYYGEPAGEVGELRRGEAKAGTTRFHCYATAYLVSNGRRLTLALAYVWAEDALLDVLIELLDRLRALGVRIRRLFLDRGFASVAILAYLDAQPFTSVVALPKRGERLKALLVGRRSYRTAYTMRSAEDGEVTFPLWVACHYAAGRRGKHGLEYWPFAVLGQPRCTLPVARLAGQYRARFGIETSYRMMHRVRPATTSRDPALRLLLVTVGWLLANLWVWLKTHLLAHTPRPHRAKARRWLEAAFRLDRFCDLLVEAIKTLYGVRHVLAYPFPYPAPSEIGNY
jgi:putative transposase